MTNTPIYRIPRDTSITLQQIIDAEAPHEGAEEAISSLVLHTLGQKGDHLSITLDWAAQLRDETGCDWGTAVSTAMTMYFG